MNESVERLSEKSKGSEERRTSGPTVLEPVAVGELADPAREERWYLATATVQPERVQPRSWRSVGQARGRPGYFLAKRCLDFCVALLALLLLAPLFLIVALLVRVTSRGPVFFRQERVGFGGRHFIICKFRSMYVDSDQNLHREAYEQFLRGERPNGKVDGAVLTQQAAHLAQDRGGAASARPRWKRFRHWTDPRVTPLGYLLRRSSIDELPQFINVLRGEMSLVGPRPPIPYEVGLYQPWHLGRLDTLPGITGLWQVRGRSRVTFDRMVQMDLEYIQKQSFWYDIRLLFLTIPAVLSRKGAS